MSIEPESHYAVLGVPPSASAEVIRKRYLALAARYHPDRHAGNPLEELAARHLVRLNEAYAVLSDARRRAAYDATCRGGGAGTSETLTSAARSARPSDARGLGRWLGWGLLLLLAPALLRALGRLVTTPGGLALALGLGAGAAILALARQRRTRRDGP